VFTCSCTSRIPEPVNYPYSQQLKLQASQHWEVLADDLANRINNELIRSDHVDKAVFVKETCGDEATPCSPNKTSSFNEAFRDLLITKLFDFGIPTNSRKDDETIEILYKVQVVRHNANRIRTVQPGLLTGLSTAIVVLRNAPSELMVIAGGVAADVANTSMSSTSNLEVIITTSLITKDRYLFRASDIYYINDKDFYHYQEQLPQTKTISLSRGNGGAKQGAPNWVPPAVPGPQPTGAGTSTQDI
jgi:hypothetical protein